ncbi:Uncharacterized protein FWK35_00036902 [Aphis craccivora]|uniref:THAP-type domain-containing protein n=1 Tax=Aphis craccivora TaxID=307492 RepID=A0A6G0VP14_APHCR|nr:Uncharacterized protein FWK35_00036902 [Aphis craccivora]
MDQQNSRYSRLLKRQKTIKQSTNNPNDNLNTTFIIETNEGDNYCKSMCDSSTQVNFECIPNNSFVFACSFEGDSVGTQITSSTGFYDNNLKFSLDKSCGPDSNTNYFCPSGLDCDKFHGFDSVKNETSLKDLTGTSFKVFDFLLSLLPETRTNVIIKKNRLLIFLMKIKLDLSFSALSVLFNVHRTTVSRTFFNILDILCFKTKNLIFWPSKHTITETLPETFKKHYPNTRCIIDCTEIKVEQPPTVEQRVYMYSHYKGCYTIKFLAAITPSGSVSFISKCYGGRSSDSFITNDSGFLKKLEPGDQILADKGFPGIKTNCENNNTILVMPPILHNGTLTEQEVLETYSIASIRIHIERFFARLKTYGILKKIPIELLPYIDNIVHICCVLTNLQPPLIKH